MKIVGLFQVLILCFTVTLTYGLDCDGIKREISIFGKTMPSGIRDYKDDFPNCKILTINQIEINDYFNMEYDSLLTMSYISFKNNTTHPRLIQYYIDEERWDLLLMTLDSMRDFDKYVQLDALEILFYQDLPFYFNVEVKEIFNFLTESEKLQLSQRLAPNMTKELKYLTKKNSYIVRFWPYFDQLVFMNHLRENFPNQFDKLNIFWREKLMSYHFNEVETKDPTFLLLNQLLIGKINEDVQAGINESFQFYYFVKTNQYDAATDYIKTVDKSVYFNSLRYFQLFKPSQQNFLMSLDINLSISDIDNLYNNYYSQVGDPIFQKWFWKKTIDFKVNLDEIIDGPSFVNNEIPQEFRSKIKIISPNSNYMNEQGASKEHYYLNDPTTQTYPSNMSIESISTLSRFYNSFKTIPFKDPTKVIHAIFPYIDIQNHQEFLDLLPYLTFNERLDLISNYPKLETFPEQFWAPWSRWFVQELYE